ncbi:MAG: glycosyltransferase family 2 protein [bacterium]
MNSKQKVDFVVVTYGNMFNDIKRTVESLYKFTPPPFNVFIVNNGSTDETATYFAKFPNCKVINLEENIGMVKGFNRGVELTEAPVIVRLDHDIELTMPWKERILAWFEEDDNIGMVGPKVLQPNNRIYSARFTFYFRYVKSLRLHNILNVPRIFRRFFYWRENHLAADTGKKYDIIEEVSHITGTFAVIRRDAFEKVGMFDEGYPEKNGVYEDLDYTLRMIEKGYKILYDGTVKVIHYCSRPESVKLKPPRSKRLNRKRLRRKWGI